MRLASLATTKQRTNEHKTLTIAGNRRSNPPPRTLFEEICLLKPEKNEVTLFAGTTYEAYVRVGIKLHGMTQVIYMINKKAALKLASSSFLLSTLTSRIER